MVGAKMSDNNIRIAFDFQYPDEAALVVYRAFNGVFGGDSHIEVVRVFTGEKAVKLYSELAGKSIDKVKEEAGCTEKGDK